MYWLIIGYVKYDSLIPLLHKYSHLPIALELILNYVMLNKKNLLILLDSEINYNCHLGV